MDDDLRSRLREALADRATFVQLVLTDIATAGDEPAYVKIAIRPAPASVAAPYQINSYTRTQHTTRHVGADDVERVLATPFRRAHLQTTQADLHVRITKKGRVLVRRGKPSTAAPPSRTHDRVKSYALPADRPDPLLQALGIQTHAGIVRASRRGKFHQINQFLDILASLPAVANASRRLHVVDCGCGASYLTFAAHRFLRETCGRDVRTIGIDANATLIARCEALRDRLGYAGLSFESCRIGEFAPTAAPDLVLSLHACDTATDEAIALGIRRRARAIVAAPCCQHELRAQLHAEPMHALLRHGILRSRQADLVTDAARAAILRVKGYRCEVVEFVSPEHTGKNLLLRADRRSSKPLPGAVKEYAALKAAWQIEPTLERLVGVP